MRRNSRRSSRKQQKSGVEGRTYVFIIAYRSRGNNAVRRDELAHCIDTIKRGFTAYKRKYKIMIVEQNNDYLFNLGLLKNIGFLEEEKVSNRSRVYLHMNVDYSIDTTKEFPKELDDFDGNGFLDIYNVDTTVDTIIGGCTCFNADVFKKINGYPIGLYGWGADDAALRNRVNYHKIPYIVNAVTNSGWIIVDGGADARDPEKQITWQENMTKATDDIEKTGLTSTVYTVDGDGEFKDTANHVVHKLVNFEYKP